MFAVYGMMSLYKSIRFLRMCPCLTQKLTSCTFKEFTTLYSLPWPSLRITKPTKKINNLYFINLPSNYSTKSPRPSRHDIHLNKRIVSLKTVEEQLGLFGSVKNSANIVNRVTMLFNIARITERDEKQMLVLELERETTQQGQSSSYMELLDCISKDISQCQPRELANVLWALGKIEEIGHKLVQVCEKEILSFHEITAFNNAEICQLVNACANLNLTSSDLFLNLQDAILDGQVKVEEFDNHVLYIILLSFAKTNNGSAELFDVFLEELLSRDFAMIDNRYLAVFVWSFAKKKLTANKLFDLVEEEILRRGTNDLCIAEFIQILWAFGKARKGSKQFFYYFDITLASRGVKSFSNAELLEIVWSFSKRSVTKGKVFDLVKNEIVNRCVQNFQTHELVLILWSFVSAQRHDEWLVAEIESELCLRDVKELDIGRLCQVVWSLGKARKTDGKLFDLIEAEVFQRGVGKFAMNEKLMLVRGFIEAKRGSKKFYELVISSFSTNDFCNLNSGTICECAWCFYKARVEAGALFDALEKEILTKGKYFFRQKEVAFIKHAFQYVGKGSRKLFRL